ncbi:MAG: hypothetical protein GXN99_02240 [Candidatus Nanohaloarchaeota archaeon]|nr:hypothetical protein [Candidatus Nanohaloarchaeota archaeon]
MIKKLKRGFMIKNKIILDGNKEADKMLFISHAHEDHLPSRKTDTAITSAITKEVANTRKSRKIINHICDVEEIKLHNAGHVPGAKMISFTIDEKKFLYTGDFSTEKTPLYEPAKPVKADVLIIDGTYISEEYIFPSQKQVIKELVDLLKDNKLNYVFAYSFGKAQTIAYWLQKYDIPYKVDESIYKINKTLEKFGYKFSGENAGDVRHVKHEEGVILAPFTKRRHLNGKGIKIGISGWALHPWFKNQQKLDYALPLSDHADHEALIKFIKKVDPVIVFGFQTEKYAFEETIKEKLGIYAVAL